MFLIKPYQFILYTILILLTGCAPSNYPYPNDPIDDNTLYSAFTQRPKHLDPARSYSSNEYIFLGQIVEPPLQYEYYSFPYTLTPLTASAIPQPYTTIVEGIERTAYDISIKPGIYFAPHPAFSTKHELTAADFIYQIKRIADPAVQSPIHALLSEHILGFSTYSKAVATTQKPEQILGVQLLDRYSYRIILKAPYPQFVYWLALPFFAPMPPEIIAWHDAPERGSNHAGIDWNPIGTGPYQMTKNDPNQEIILERNPHYRTVPDPKNPRNHLPYIDKITFKLEPENIPYWQKFLQGYFDASGIGSDQFDQAITITPEGDFERSSTLIEQGIQLKKTPEPSIFYMGFNMLDSTIGGYSPSQKALRQAIAIAVDYEEMISIFANGRGSVAHSPIPPGIYGHTTGANGINPITHDWIDGQAVRKPISAAHELLRKAGYPNGIDPKTQKPLILHFDTASTGPDSRARLTWLRKQFDKLNIQLVIRATDYNRFQEKMQTGNAQIFEWGWNADYPDPENFFFLLYGPNGKVKHHGVNSANYINRDFDALFEQMRLIPNSAQRLQIIREMTHIVRQDSPWLWGFNPLRIALYHQWLSNINPNPMAHNTLQYRQLQPELRAQLRTRWNQPKLLPLTLLTLLLLLITTYAIIRYRQKQNHKIST